MTNLKNTTAAALEAQVAEAQSIVDANSKFADMPAFEVAAFDEDGVFDTPHAMLVSEKNVNRFDYAAIAKAVEKTRGTDSGGIALQFVNQFGLSLAAPEDYAFSIGEVASVRQDYAAGWFNAQNRTLMIAGGNRDILGTHDLPCDLKKLIASTGGEEEQFITLISIAEIPHSGVIAVSFKKTPVFKGQELRDLLIDRFAELLEDFLKIRETTHDAILTREDYREQAEIEYAREYEADIS